MTVPDIDFESRTLRAMIIQVLSKEQGLSAKELFEFLTINNKSITYPAVYKTLKILTAEKKILKQNRKFMLNMDWILKLKEFIENIEHSSTIGVLPPLEYFEKENTSNTFYFKNYEQADIYRKQLQWTYLREKRPVPYCGIYRHLKSPVIKSGKSLAEIKHLKEKGIKSFLIAAFDTPIDRWCEKFYTRNPGVSIKIGAEIPSVEVCETLILGDIVVQIYIPDELKKLTDKIYNKTKSFDSLDVLEFYDKIYRTPAKVKIVAFNNKNIAHLMREQVLSHFKKKS